MEILKCENSQYFVSCFLYNASYRTYKTDTHKNTKLRNYSSKLGITERENGNDDDNSSSFFRLRLKKTGNDNSASSQPETESTRERTASQTHRNRTGIHMRVHDAISTNHPLTYQPQ